MADKSFKEQVAEAKAAQARSKDMDGEFPADPPVGVYIGKLQTLKAGISRKERPQVTREILITEGESKGMVARDYTSLVQDFLIARMREYVSLSGYEMPEAVIDYAESEKTGEFVINSDFAQTLLAIEGEEPEYKFQFEKSQGTFNQITIIEVLSSGGSGEGPSSSTDAPGETDGVPDDLRFRAKGFAVSQGLEVGEGDDMDAVTKALKEYVFWTPGISQEQLDKEGYEGKPEDGITHEDVELLGELGLDDLIIEIKEQAPKRTAAKKKTGGAKKRAK